MTDLPYIYRWNGDRKGQACEVLARSRRTLPPWPINPGIPIVGATPAPKNFNSILIRFADGHTTITSGNSIKRNTK